MLRVGKASIIDVDFSREYALNTSNALDLKRLNHPNSYNVTYTPVGFLKSSRL